MINVNSKINKLIYNLGGENNIIFSEKFINYITQIVIKKYWNKNIVNQLLVIINNNIEIKNIWLDFLKDHPDFNKIKS